MSVPAHVITPHALKPDCEGALQARSSTRSLTTLARSSSSICGGLSVPLRQTRAHTPRSAVNTCYLPLPTEPNRRLSAFPRLLRTKGHPAGPDRAAGNRPLAATRRATDGAGPDGRLRPACRRLGRGSAIATSLAMTSSCLRISPTERRSSDLPSWKSPAPTARCTDD
jgi:hypothetical protein